METGNQQSVESYIASLPAEERELARHVLLGYINEKTRRPVGFHHAPNGVAPPGRRIDEILRRYPDGSYLAVVYFWDPKQRAWVQKGKDDLHSMFPDHWSPEQILAAGREAYQVGVEGVKGSWKGRGRGMSIRGYHRSDRSGPATFYPGLKR